jgi:hypothetical protein
LKRETLLDSRISNIPIRIVFWAAGTLAFVVAYYIGAVMPLPAADAEAIRSEFLLEIDDIDQIGIFLNNIAVAVGMFIPGVGVGLGGYSGVSTGIVYNAFAQASPELQRSSPLAVLATPFGLLEVMAYGIAMSRSGMLVAQLVKNRSEWKRFTLFTLVEVGIVVVALVLGSLIEAQVIQSQEI